tara:strand:- start:668 stop:826 length:159 start_codon:yes stop_codon:yes gene_type:complete
MRRLLSDREAVQLLRQMQRELRAALLNTFPNNSFGDCFPDAAGLNAAVQFNP